MHALLIEGNEDDACLIGELLTGQIAADIELEWTDRLRSGLTRVTEGNIDVVLLDLSLPDSRGLQTLDTIQTQAPDLPIIVLTHLDDEVTAVQAVSMSGHNTKGETPWRACWSSMTKTASGNCCPLC